MTGVFGRLPLARLRESAFWGASATDGGDPHTDQHQQLAPRAVIEVWAGEDLQKAFVLAIKRRYSGQASEAARAKVKYTVALCRTRSLIVTWGETAIDRFIHQQKLSCSGDRSPYYHILIVCSSMGEILAHMWACADNPVRCTGIIPYSSMRSLLVYGTRYFYLGTTRLFGYEYG